MLVVVAMSGGVDSSVAAALLREEGHEVVGVTMQIWPEGQRESEERRGGCCAVGAVRDARAVADGLGIPYYVFQMREEFHAHVIAEFASAYAAGRTPNPCVACNEHIKFRALLEKARRLGADALATGHYARVRRAPDGTHRLCRGADGRKDQSYVLHPLCASDLPFLRFPTGEMTKPEVRAKASALGLPVADKPDSQEICFVGPGGHAEIVGNLHPEALRPGPIVDVDGRFLGQHRGLAHYTVGQRKGLGLAGQAPRFVVEVDALRNTVVVGSIEDAFAWGATIPRVNWLVPETPAVGLRCAAKVRSGPAEHAAVLEEVQGHGAVVRFLEPVRAVTPGQACVLYDGDVVLGGGEIGSPIRGESGRVAAAARA